MADSAAFEIIETLDHHVYCEGGGGPLGHPRVYLAIDHHQHQTTCPYCSRTFRLSPDAPPPIAH